MYINSYNILHLDYFSQPCLNGNSTYLSNGPFGSIIDLDWLTDCDWPPYWPNEHTKDHLTDWLRLTDLTDWTNRWKTIWLTDWPPYWLNEQMKDHRTDWLTDLLTDWTNRWKTIWLTDWPPYWLNEQMKGHLTDWLNDLLITDRPTDWLTHHLTDWHCGLFY